MGQFIAPPYQENQFEKGCLRVYYPRHPLLFAALLGQLYELTKRYRWDTSGNVPWAENIASQWFEFIDDTVENAQAGCGGDSEDCQDTITELTHQIEDLIIQIQEYENMNITVNCNCGCCGDGIPNNLTNPDGTPTDVTMIPIPTDDPFGEDVPTWDSENEQPPPGYSDYQEFLDKKCLAANFMFDLLVEGVETLDLAENISSKILDTVTTFLANLPEGLKKTTTYLKALEIVKMLADALTDYEDALDWAQLIQQVALAYRKEIICAIYKAPDAVTAAASVAVITTPAIVAALLVDNAYGNHDKMAAVWTKILDTFIPQAYSYQVVELIPEGYQPQVNCASCDDPELPEGVNNFVVNQASWGTYNGGFMEILPGGVIRMIGNVGVNNGVNLAPILTEYGHQWNKDNGSWSRGFEFELLSRKGPNTGQVWLLGGTGRFHGQVENIQVGQRVRGTIQDFAMDWRNSAERVDVNSNFVNRTTFTLMMINGGSSGYYEITGRLRVLTTDGSEI